MVALRLGVGFQGILDKAITGATLSESEIMSWEKMKEKAGLVGGEPDIVEMAGMIKGFEPRYADGFPLDLREKLNDAWRNCDSIEKKYEFMHGFDMNFTCTQLPNGIQRWASNWRECIEIALNYMDQNRMSTKGQDSAVKFLRSLL